MESCQRSILDTIRLGYGVESVSELYGRRLNLWVLAESFNNASESILEPPRRLPGELRPVIMTSALSEWDEVEVAARALLIYDSVVLIVADSINYLDRLLRVVLLLEDLIDAGAVILLPESAVFSDESSDGYFDAIFGQIFRMTRSSQPRSKEERDDDARHLALRMELALGMDACKRFPNRFDLALTSPNQRNMLRELLGKAAAETSLAASADRVRWLPDLLELRMARISLATKELLALRRDGLFDAWRQAVASALRDTMSLSESDVIDPHGVRMEEVRAALNNAAESQRLNLRQSKLVRSAVIGSTSIAVGCATGALGAIGGLEIAAVAGGVGSGASLALDWLGGRPTSKERAFRRFVAELFGTSRPDTTV